MYALIIIYLFIAIIVYDHFFSPYSNTILFTVITVFDNFCLFLTKYTYFCLVIKIVIRVLLLMSHVYHIILTINV